MEIKTSCKFLLYLYSMFKIRKIPYILAKSQIFHIFATDKYHRLGLVWIGQREMWYVSMQCVSDLHYNLSY